MASQIKHKLVKNLCDAIHCKTSNGNYNDIAGGYKFFQKANGSVVWAIKLPIGLRDSINSDILHNANKELLENKAVKRICVDNANPLVEVELDVKRLIKDVLESDPTKINYQSSPKKALIEFSSPNIAKPFHVGHLRSTIIGNSIANIKKKFGDDIIRMNYLGDWGTQFGILQLGINLKGFTEEDLQKNPLEMLLNAYVMGNAEAEKHPELYEQAKNIFCELESGKEEITQLWTRYKNWTIDELSVMYDRLGVSFDKYCWESDFSKNKSSNILKMLEEKKILTEDGKSRKVVVIGDKTIPLLKSDGTTLYMFRDLVAAIDRRKEYSFDEMYYVVENSQSEHFQMLFSILSELKINEGVKIEHVKFGRVIGMSSRKGKCILLSDVLNEAQERVFEKQKESSRTKVALDTKVVADILGVSAVVVNDLIHKRLKDYEFCWDEMMKLKGKTGIALQYCHSRLCNLEIESGVKAASECDPEALLEPEALDLIFLIARYEPTLHASLKKLEPCVLTVYLFELAKAVNSAYSKLPVKNSDSHTSSQRLLMFNKSREVLNEGLRLLGLKPLNKM